MTSGASSSSSTRPARPFILVVEDITVEYMIWKKLITTMFKGANVQHAKYVDEAWKLLEIWAKEKNLPDMILSDCDMLGQQRHGPDLLKDVKNDNRFKHIPVVMMSSAMDSKKGFPEELMRAGAEAALQKPIKMAQINEWDKFFL